MSVDLTAKFTTWIDKAHPTTCYFGKTGYAAVQSGQRVALIQFASPFPPHTQQNVEKATLRLRLRATRGQVSVTVAQLTHPFTPSRATWNNINQTAGFAVTNTFAASNSNDQVVDFDVTKGLQGVASGSPLYGFIVTTSNSGTLLFEGNMTPALNPHLIVSFTQAPLAPTSLEPAGGRRVGDPQPVLTFVNTDVAGNRNLVGVQVQMSSTSTFDKLTFDSGTIATTTPQVDLSTLQGSPTLASGATVWWRVRTQDGAGLWSDYSLPASFTYTPRPTVTLRNPDSSSPTVYDPTPPIDWTYYSTAGSNQSRYRVVIYQTTLAGGFKVWQDSGVLLGADTEWTPAKALPKSGSYRVVVNAWDSYTDRQATPGATTNGGVVQDFTYTHLDYIPAPHLVSVTKPDKRMPALQITWTRTDQPDEWVVYRDGKLFSQHDGDVLAVGTNTYRWTDRLCPAGAHTWTVFALVNGKLGEPLTVTYENRFLGTWLYRDDDTHTMVCIVNDREHALTLPETSQQVDVLGSQIPVTIVTAMQGYQGKVEGNLVPIFGLPADQTVELWRQRMLDFKADVGQRFRLVGVGDLDLPIVIHNVNVAPVPASGDPVFSVSFDYSQCDDFPVDFD